MAENHKEVETNAAIFGRVRFAHTSAAYGEIDGKYFKGKIQVCFAIVYVFGELPTHSEMGWIVFFDSFPDELEFPESRNFFSITLEKKS